MKIRVLICLSLTLFAVNPLIPCRMLGVIALPGASLSELDSLQHFHPYLMEELEELRLQGGSGNWPYNNRDGWGMTSYSTTENFPQVLTVRSEIEAYADETYYEQTALLLAPDEVTVLLGHLRQTTSGAIDIENPHPFIYTTPGGQQFSFAHNGDLDKDVLRELIGDDWLADHPPQTYGGGAWDDTGWSQVVDSELFFFWIMQNIELLNDIESGIQQALIVLENELPTEFKTFLLSDGIDLYAYSSSVLGDLYYFDGSDEVEPPWYLEGSNHRAIMSTPPPTGVLAEIPWVQLATNVLLCLRADATTDLFDVLSSIEISAPPVTPDHSKVIHAFPNPFNARTIIPVTWNQTGDLKLKIYDARGRLVYELIKAKLQPGDLQLNWAGRDDQGHELSSGNYFFTVSGDQFISSGKLLLLK